MAIDPNIALNVKTLELPNQLAQYGQVAQILAARDTQQLNALKMQEYERTRAEEEGTRNFLRSQKDLYAPEVRAGLLQFGKTGREFAKNISEQETAAANLTKTNLESITSKRNMVNGMMRDLSNRPDDENVKSHFRDVMESPLFTQAEKTDLQARTDRLLKMPFEERKSFLASQGASAGDLRPQTVASGGSLVQDGKAIFTAPPAPSTPTNLAKLQNELAALPPGDPRRAQYEALIRKEVTHAPGTTVTVNTAKQYGEAFGGKLADVDIGKMNTAEKAPQLAESANRIIGIVKQGNVFTGPIADVKLNVARALNVAGANNQEKIANTESLIAATGQSTLDAIKGAGLGTGQGFTDKDLKFLQGVAGGTINLTPQTLTELATLQHRAATRSADAWNTRVREMPQEVVKGTGISTAPIKVAPLSSIMGKPASTVPAPAGVDPALWNAMTPQEQKLWVK